MMTPAPMIPGGAHRIGRFELRRQLGKGGCGIVFLAFDPKLAARGGPQDPPARNADEPGRQAAAHPRGAGGGRVRPPEPRTRVRDRRDRPGVLHRHRVLPRPDARRLARPAGVPGPGAAGGAARRHRRRGRPARPRPRRAAPRPEAEQCHPSGVEGSKRPTSRRPAACCSGANTSSPATGGLRAGEAGRARWPVGDRHAADPRHAEVHGPGAGPGAARGHRPAGRRVRPRASSCTRCSPAAPRTTARPTWRCCGRRSRGSRRRRGRCGRTSRATWRRSA